MAVSSQSGFYGHKLSLDAAKREVQSTLNPGKIRLPALPRQKDPQFSAFAKKLFENAQVVRVFLSFQIHALCTLTVCMCVLINLLYLIIVQTTH